MVLLKNRQNILPFAKGTKLALLGIGTFDYSAIDKREDTSCRI
jgi:hypothetical protein